MNPYEYIALTLSITGLYFTGSTDYKYRCYGFFINVLGCAMWIIAIPILSVTLVNLIFAITNIINIYRVKRKY